MLSSSVSTGGDSAGGDFELRIPSSRLRPALRDLAALADVRTQTQTGRDVTREHVTAKDRLQAARAERRSLLRRLELATTDEEAEAIRRRLDLVAGEINGLRSPAARPAAADRLRRGHGEPAAQGRRPGRRRGRLVRRRAGRRGRPARGRGRLDRAGARGRAAARADRARWPGSRAARCGAASASQRWHREPRVRILELSLQSPPSISRTRRARGHTRPARPTPGCAGASAIRSSGAWS